MHKSVEVKVHFRIIFHTFKVGNKYLWRWGWDRVTDRLFAVDLGPVGIALKLIK